MQGPCSQNEAAPCAKSLPFAEQKRIYLRQLLAPLTGWSQRNKQIKPPPPSPPPTNQPVLDFRARSTPADDSLEKLPLWNCVRRFRAGGAHAFFEELDLSHKSRTLRLVQYCTVPYRSHKMAPHKSSQNGVLDFYSVFATLPRATLLGTP